MPGRLSENKAIPSDDPLRQRWVTITELAVLECKGVDQAGFTVEQEGLS